MILAVPKSNGVFLVKRHFGYLLITSEKHVAAHIECFVTGGLIC